MPIPFQPPDPIYPTWGQSLGGGLDRFVQNYAMARKQKITEDIMAHQMENDVAARAASDARQQADVANFQATQGTFLTPGQFTQANAALAAPEGIRAPMAPNLIEEVQRIHTQGRNIQAGRATTNVLNLGTGETTSVRPGTRVVSGGKAPSAKQDYINDIVSRYRSDNSSVTPEEMQIAGLSSKRMILSGETVKLVTNARSGMVSLERMAEVMGRRPEIYRYARPGVIGTLGSFASSFADEGEAQSYQRDFMEASDVITRLRTGAALNRNEEVYYPKLIATILTHPKTAMENVEKLKNFFQQVGDEIESGKRTPGGDGRYASIQGGSVAGGGASSAQIPTGMIRLKSGKMYDPATGKVQ